MKDVFTPPIKSRTTTELLEIVGAPRKWNEDAVQLAQLELAARKVPARKIKTATYLDQKRDRIAKVRRANEGFNVLDFILRPRRTLFIIIFSWELKKDGFHRKARQQKVIRLVIIAVFIIVYTMTCLRK